jgi:hypothetical protein
MRLFNAVNECIYPYVLFFRHLKTSDLDTMKSLCDGMKLDNYQKIIMAIGLLQYPNFVDKDEIPNYIRMLIQEVPINNIYNTIYEYDLLPNIMHFTFKMDVPHIFSLIHENININNKKLTKFLLVEIDYVIDYYESLQQKGYDFLANKNKFLNKFLNRMQILEALPFIQYLIENGAIPKKMERKKYKNDDQIVLEYLEKHGIKSLGQSPKIDDNRFN